MQLRLSPWAAPATAVLLSLLAGCGEEPTPPGAYGGSPAGGTSPAPGGFGGSGGSGAVQNSAGATFGGSAGLGAGGGGFGGVATAGTSFGGSAGSSTVGGSGGLAGSSTVGGGSSGAAAVPATFETVKLVLLGDGPASCFGGLCHDLPEHIFKLKEETGEPFTDNELHTLLRSHVTRNCGQLVNLASPAESALVKLLRGPCGSSDRMPMGKCFEDGDEGCVPPTQIAAIEQWIANGAPQ